MPERGMDRGTKDEWLALLKEWRNENPHRKHLTETKLLPCEVDKRPDVAACPQDMNP
jgi:hypothetical protein